MQRYIFEKRCILPIKPRWHWDYKHIRYVCNRKCRQVFDVEYIKELLAIVSLQCYSCFTNRIRSWKLIHDTHNYCSRKISLKHITLIGRYL